jgi:hypothetical protein
MGRQAGEARIRGWILALLTLLFLTMSLGAQESRYAFEQRSANAPVVFELDAQDDPALPESSVVTVVPVKPLVHAPVSPSEFCSRQLEVEPPPPRSPLGSPICLAALGHRS